MGEEWKVYKVLVEKPEGKRPLGRPWRMWEEEIIMELREIGWGSVEWIQLAQEKDQWRALVNTMKNLRVLAPRSYLFSQIVDSLLSSTQTKLNFYRSSS
jgi:hypothetical protein